MYSADLVIWILHLLIFGESGESYNVGGEKVYSIKDMANLVNSFFPSLKLKIEGKPTLKSQVSRYIPLKKQRVRTEYQLIRLSKDYRIIAIICNKIKIKSPARSFKIITDIVTPINCFFDRFHCF